MAGCRALPASSHFTLYALLLAVPLLGMVVQLKRGNALPIFGFWQVRRPGRSTATGAAAFCRCTNTLADALLILAAVHSAAALVHHWVWRDRTLSRMLPGARLARANVATRRGR